MNFSNVILSDLQSAKRNMTLKMLTIGKGDNIVNLKFTVEQFHLLDELELNADYLEDRAFGRNNVNLILYLSSRYRLKCNLQKNINDIRDEGIVTIYKENADYNTMIKNGFIPCPSVKMKHYREIILYLSMNMPPEEITKWTRIQDVYSYLSSNVFWSIITKSYLEISASKCDSYPIMFFDVDMVYSSMRPKTKMLEFQTPNSTYYDEIPRNSIPVTRYRKTMSSGMYYGDRPENICGYFYYYEPESTTYLSYNTMLRAFNKTTAAVMLVKRLHHEPELVVELQELIRDVDTNVLLHKEGQLPQDLKMTHSQYKNFYAMFDDDYQEENPDEMPVYVGKMIDMYAKEDDFDQPLCRAASKLGIDLVVLTHMVGSHQVVTEVLDTRDDSFSHLRFKS